MIPDTSLLSAVEENGFAIVPAVIERNDALALRPLLQAAIGGRVRTISITGWYIT